VNGQQCNPATADATITVTSPDDDGTICTTMASALLLKYTGPTILGQYVKIITTNMDNTNDFVLFGTIDLIQNETVLSLASENGFSVDATAHGELALGTSVKMLLAGLPHVNLDTSCNSGNPLQSNAPAPLSGFTVPTPSPDWFVIDFNQTE
jgi:hypothetical protein